MKKTYWIADNHQDLGVIACSDPEVCTEASHWDTEEQEFASEADAVDYAENYSDFPAYRISKVEMVMVVKTELVKVMRFATEHG